jgi:uncharacterized membrane protein YccC
MSATAVFDGQGLAAWPGRLLQRVGLGDGAAARGLLFGLRLWAAVCLSLYLSFWLQLDNPYWSGISAAVVCQPGVGAALRKGVARWVGTFAGATAVVLLAALFPQDRIGFFLGLAVWGGGCGFLATALRDQASYAAALAGYTAAIIAGNVIGPSGQVGADVFMLALTRVTEIWIGLISAEIVFIATDVGGARERLASSLEGLVCDLGTGLRKAVAGAEDRASLAARQSALFGRIAALDVQISDAVGEDPGLRPDAPALRASAFGLFVALAGWRRVMDDLNQTLDRNPLASAPLEVPDLYSGFCNVESARSQTRAFVRERLRFAGDSVSLLAASDAYAEALLGLLTALDALAVVRGETTRTIRGAIFARPLDGLPALIVAARVVLAVGAVELLWVVTAWPDAGSAVGYVAVSVILFSPRGAQGYAGAITFLLGCSLGVRARRRGQIHAASPERRFRRSLPGAGCRFNPARHTLPAHSRGAFYIFAAVNFGVGLNIGNVTNYNVEAFYNQALAVAVGSFAAVAAIALAPPLSADALVRRATRSAAREMRELADRRHTDLAQWGQRIYGRLADLPAHVDPSLLSLFVAVAQAGAEIIRLNRLERRLRRGGFALASALQYIANDERGSALARLATLEQELATYPSYRRTSLRVRSALGRLITSLRQLDNYGDGCGLR